MPRYRPTPAKLAVLHRLAKKPMTVSEVGRGLGIDKAAAYRHLVGLVREGVVERQATDRKWVYYCLTDAGKDSLKRTELVSKRE